MKRTITTILVGTILTTGFVFATTPAREFKSLVNDLLMSGESISVSTPDRIQSYQQAINVIQGKINELQSQKMYKCQDGSIQYGKPCNGDLQNPDVNSCQKISQTLWQGKSDTDTAGEVTILNTFLENSGFRPKNTCTGDTTCGGYHPFDIYDSYFTVTGVKNFQTKYGISPTGAVGPKTLAKINSMICANTSVNPSKQINCPKAFCAPAACPSGQSPVFDTPIFGSDGCQTNMCASSCRVNTNPLNTGNPGINCVAYDFKLSTSDNMYHSTPTYFAEGENYNGSCTPLETFNSAVYPGLPPRSCRSENTYQCHGGHWLTIPQAISN